jgi:hypothetical protein
VNGDNFGFGDCREGTECNWPCSQAGANEHGLCRWHFKVKFKIAFPYRPEAKVPTSKKAKVPR